MPNEGQWRRCNACKQPIRYGADYYVCCVSTCNRKRTGLAFCSVSCWEVHLPVANHREAWAEDRTAPSGPERSADASEVESSPRRRIVRGTGVEKREEAAPKEILIVANRLKDYIRGRSGFNTSERVLGPLSDLVRRICDEAILNAERDGRKTVLDRDVPH